MTETYKDREWRLLDFLVVHYFVVFQHMTEASSYVACLGYDCPSKQHIKLQFNTVSGLDHNDANLLNMYFQCASNNYRVTHQIRTLGWD